MPTLQARWTALRAIRRSDHEWIYAIASEPSSLVDWRFRGATPNPDEFAIRLWDQVLAQFAIVGRSTGEPVGLVTAYAADFRNDVARVAVLLRPDVRRAGWPLEAVALFLDYLFRNWSFRKLYFESVEFNLAKYGRSRAFDLFEEEGRLKRHEFYDGRYWDYVTLAVYRERWEALASLALGATD